MKPSKETQSIKNPKLGMNTFRTKRAQQLLGRCYDAALRYIGAKTKYGSRYKKSELFEDIQRGVGFAPGTYMSEVIKLLVENKIITTTPRDFIRYEIRPVERKAPVVITRPAPMSAAPASETGQDKRVFHPCPDAPASAAQVADLNDNVAGLRMLVVALAVDVQRLIEEVKKR